MLRRSFGSTGDSVPVIGQGTWQLRTGRRAAAALRLGLDLGLTHIDTAELYTGSEEIIRDAIQGRRNEVFLVSKVLPNNASRAGVVDHCRKSLQRLGVDQLDVYLLHWLEKPQSLEASMRGLGDVLDQGLARFIGVSNFDVADLEHAQSYLGHQRIVCDQVYYSPTHRGAENELVSFCRQNQIALVAYSPFDSGRFDPGKGPMQALERVATRNRATPHQVVLNFLARQEGVFVIPKSESEPHVRDNAASLDFQLSKQDLDELDTAFPKPKPGTPLAVI